MKYLVLILVSIPVFLFGQASKGVMNITHTCTVSKTSPFIVPARTFIVDESIEFTVYNGRISTYKTDNERGGVRRIYFEQVPGDRVRTVKMYGKPCWQFIAGSRETKSQVTICPDSFIMSQNMTYKETKNFSWIRSPYSLN